LLEEVIREYIHGCCGVDQIILIKEIRIRYSAHAFLNANNNLASRL